MRREKMDPGRAIQVSIAVAATSSVMTAWLGMRVGSLIQLCENPLDAIYEIPSQIIPDIIAYPTLVEFDGAAAICALIGFAIPWVIVMVALLSRQDHTRKGEEHGSARWATKGEIAPYANLENPDPVYNVHLLSANAALALSRKTYSQRYDRNVNVLVLGGSGTGKTRYYVKPNILQCYGDYIVTDPKGDLLGDVGHLLEAHGYEVTSFNTFIPEQSLVYNPLHYVRSDLEILSFAKMFISMTTGDQRGKSDPFWEKSEQMLYMACIAYMRDYLPEKDYHIGTLIKLMSMAKVSEQNENAMSPLDCVFEELKTGWRIKRVRDSAHSPRRRAAAPETYEETVAATEGRARFTRVPSPYRRRSDGAMPYRTVRAGRRGFTPTDDFALLNYTSFKQAAGKTMKSIIISCNVRLAPFTTAEVKRITCGRDRMHLESFGDPERPRALFAIFRDTDQQTLGWLHGMLVYQAINILCEKALREHGGRLPRNVDFILDEYRSLNLPSDISAMISVVRSRNISMSIILQGISQLAELYDEKTAESIRACCDSTLFLGASANDEASRKFISDACGQMTVYDTNESVQHGGSGGWSRQKSKLQRPLITPDEVGRLDRTECIVFIGGQCAYRDKKYPLEKHPRYREMASRGGYLPDTSPGDDPG